jgi:hypothetical protein
VLISGLAVVGAPTGATAKSIRVKAGESIQAAVDRAAPGDTIKVLPGDYTETAPSAVAAVRITKPLRLVAEGGRHDAKVRILWNGLETQRDGILAEPAGPGRPDINGLEIRGFTVEGFQHNGIFLRHVKNFSIEDNESVNNLENGIWPTLSANGLVKRNVSYGSQDSALWVEASENVRVINNDLHHSPTGLEITVSKEITAETNDIHDNTIGVGLYPPAAAGLESPWPYADLGHWHIINNYVHDNNEPNTAEGGETAALPPGIGILLLGVDHIDVQKNLIESNDFVGFAMADWCLAVFPTEFACSASTPDVEGQAPDFNRVIGNKFANNHADYPTGEPFQSSDILDVGLGWINDGSFGTGTGNCFSNNRLAKTRHSSAALLTFPDPLPACEQDRCDGPGAGHGGSRS